MRTKIAILLGMSAFSAVACNYELYDDGEYDDWEWDEDDDDDKAAAGTLEERALQTCDAFCVGLVECGVVEGDAFLACRNACVSKYEADEDEVRSGCDCVAAAKCDVELARECETDPLPGVWLGGGNGSGGGSASGGNEGAGGGVGAGGASSGVPCVASCQCAEGEACEEGFCAMPTEPELMCDTDCDCTSGEACTGGFCE